MGIQGARPPIFPIAIHSRCKVYIRFERIDNQAYIENQALGLRWTSGHYDNDPQLDVVKDISDFLALGQNTISVAYNNPSGRGHLKYEFYVEDTLAKTVIKTGWAVEIISDETGNGLSKKDWPLSVVPAFVVPK